VAALYQLLESRDGKARGAAEKQDHRWQLADGRWQVLGLRPEITGHGPQVIGHRRAHCNLMKRNVPSPETYDL
jgi:hypothetical protein